MGFTVSKFMVLSATLMLPFISWSTSWMDVGRVGSFAWWFVDDVHVYTCHDCKWRFSCLFELSIGTTSTEQLGYTRSHKISLFHRELRVCATHVIQKTMNMIYILKNRSVSTHSPPLTRRSTREQNGNNEENKTQLVNNKTQLVNTTCSMSPGLLAHVQLVTLYFQRSSLLSLSEQPSSRWWWMTAINPEEVDTVTVPSWNPLWYLYCFFTWGHTETRIWADWWCEHTRSPKASCC